MTKSQTGPIVAAGDGDADVVGLRGRTRGPVVRGYCGPRLRKAAPPARPDSRG